MKIDISKLGDTTKTVEALNAAKVEDTGFLDYLRTLGESFILALRDGGLGFENFNAIQKEATLFHGETTEISTGNKRSQAYCVLPLQTLPFENPPLSFAWQYNSAGKLVVRATFLGAPATKCTVKLLILF